VPTVHGLLVPSPIISFKIISKYDAGSDMTGISSETAQGCKIDQAVYVSHHGSRYPDPGAYDAWVALYNKVYFLLSYRFSNI
jgi:hypothetical protein